MISLSKFMIHLSVPCFLIDLNFEISLLFFGIILNFYFLTSCSIFFIMPFCVSICFFSRKDFLKPSSFATKTFLCVVYVYFGQLLLVAGCRMNSQRLCDFGY